MYLILKICLKYRLREVQKTFKVIIKYKKKNIIKLFSSMCLLKKNRCQNDVIEKIVTKKNENWKKTQHKIYQYNRYEINENELFIRFKW